MPKVQTSKDAYNILINSWDDNKLDLVEEFKVLYLNRANKVTGLYSVSSGGITGTIADPRIILAGALKTHAVSMVLAHSHPSGNLKESRQDIELTEKIKQAGNFLEVKLLDHLIVTRDGYSSLADLGFI